jgi:hypothetical protein
MLIVAQLQTKTSSDILQRILNIRSVDEILSYGSLENESAPMILRLLSGHLNKLCLRHKITIYDDNKEPNLLFLNCTDEFPQDLIPGLVSILVTQDMAPVSHPSYPDYYIGDM